MPRSHAAPLTELSQLLGREFAGKGQYAVKHRGHVSRVKEKAVASNPLGIFRVIDKEFCEKCVYEIGSPHGTARVTRFGFLNHGCYQHAKVVGSTIELYSFLLIHIFL